MFSKIITFGLNSFSGNRIEVETDISRGIPEFKLVGLCSVGVQEATRRVRSALRNQGFEFPNGRVTVNLAPADLRKDGSGFDLPIAMGLLASAGIILPECVKNTAFIGELSLDGSVKPVRGVLPMVLCAKQSGIERIFVPKENVGEAVLSKINVVGVDNLREAVDALRGNLQWVIDSAEKLSLTAHSQCQYDFADVLGQEVLKRSVEVAISGQHNILFMGSRGCGKTMIAKCIPGILPQMTEQEMLETASVYSAAGLLKNSYTVGERPFREVHSGVTATALVGGGHMNMPGEISLAHNGVLFCDELTEIHPSAIDSLRQPLEEHISIVSRYGITERYPADFLFVGAANPCKCGNLFEGYGKCSCTKLQVKSKLSRISAPIMDRMDIHIPVTSVKYSDIHNKKSESSAEIRARIERTRQIQHERYRNENVKLNGRLDRRQTERYCKLDRAAKRFLSAAMENQNFSIRGYDKVLRIARTIADMEGHNVIQQCDVAEAVQYRAFDRAEVLEYGRVS